MTCSPCRRIQRICRVCSLFQQSDKNMVELHVINTIYNGMVGLGMSLQQMQSNVDNHPIGSYRAMMSIQNDSDSVHGSNVKDTIMASLHSVSSPSIIGDMLPKKRGRKKKNSTDDGYVCESWQINDTSLTTTLLFVYIILNICRQTRRLSTPFGLTNEPAHNQMKQISAKERKKHDRFNGMTEEEVSKRTLPDHLADNLDIIIVSVIFHFAQMNCSTLSGARHTQRRPIAF